MDTQQGVESRAISSGNSYMENRISSLYDEICEAKDGYISVEIFLKVVVAFHVVGNLLVLLNPAKLMCMLQLNRSWRGTTGNQSSLQRTSHLKIHLGNQNELQSLNDHLCQEGGKLGLRSRILQRSGLWMRMEMAPSIGKPSPSSCFILLSSSPSVRFLSALTPR